MYKLKKNYRIKLRNKKDYIKLNPHYSDFSLLFPTSIFFNNDIQAILEEDTVLIKSKLTVSAVTVGCSILIILYSVLIFHSTIGGKFMIIYPVILFVTLDTIIKFEHQAIEGQILKRLYED